MFLIKLNDFKKIIIFINIVHFILTIEQLIAMFNVGMNNVLITHRVLPIINVGIEGINLLMCTVAYAVAKQFYTYCHLLK